MKPIENSVEIYASDENIFELLAADRFSDWIPGFEKNKAFEYITEVKTQQDKYKPGTTATFDVSCHFEMAESTKNEKVKYKFYEKNIFGYCEGYLTYNIMSKEDSSLVTCLLEGSKPDGFYGKLFYVTVYKYLDRQMVKELNALKRVAEKLAAT